MAISTGTLNIPTLQPIAVPDAKDPYKTTNATASTATATGYDPSAFNVTKDQTVQGQLTDLIDKNSPYMQQAQRRALQGMNDRGLLNSSIAVGAGQDAAIQAALPIAATDAGTFNQAMTNTVNAQNAAKNFEAGAKNTASLQNAQLGTQTSLANAEAANTAANTAYQAGTQLQLAGLQSNTQIALANLDSQTKAALAVLDANTKIQIDQLDNQFRTLLQTNQSAANLEQQAMQTIAQISQSTTLDQYGKDNAIQSQVNLLKQGLLSIQNTNPTDAAALANLNLGQFFSTAPTGGTTGGTGTVLPTTAAYATSESNFDAQRYLNENPDVAQAVAAGTIPSAWFHYIHHGQQEGRKAYQTSGYGSSAAPPPPKITIGNPTPLPASAPPPAAPTTSTTSGMYAAGWTNLGGGMWRDPITGQTMGDAQAQQTFQSRGY